MTLNTGLWMAVTGTICRPFAGCSAPMRIRQSPEYQIAPRRRIRCPRLGKPGAIFDDADEGGHFTGQPGFRPLYIRRQLGLRATARCALTSVSCTKRPNGRKAGVKAFGPRYGQCGYTL